MSPIAERDNQMPAGIDRQCLNAYARIAPLANNAGLPHDAAQMENLTVTEGQKEDAVLINASGNDTASVAAIATVPARVASWTRWSDDAFPRQSCWAALTGISPYICQSFPGHFPLRLDVTERTMWATLTGAWESMMAAATNEEIERFNSKWSRVGDCHIWTGGKDRDGYGIITFRRASRRAHRVALFLAGQQIPDGHVVNHTCGRRDCVNPQHLNAISSSDNALRDSRSLGYVNSQKTHCKNGHEFDRVYGGQRYCSRCEAEKSKRLRAKWKAVGIFKI